MIRGANLYQQGKVEPRDLERDPRPWHDPRSWEEIIPTIVEATAREGDRGELGFWHQERGRSEREKSRDIGERGRSDGFRVCWEGRPREKE